MQAGSVNRGVPRELAGDDPVLDEILQRFDASIVSVQRHDSGQKITTILPCVADYQVSVEFFWHHAEPYFKRMWLKAVGAPVDQIEKLINKPFSSYRAKSQFNLFCLMAHMDEILTGNTAMRDDDIHQFDEPKSK